MWKGEFDATQSSQGVSSMIGLGLKGHRLFVDIVTPFLHKIIEATGDVTWLEKALPFNHLGQPKNIGQAAVWLASGRESGYVTGNDLSIDGGFLAR
jgi:NAD(P)-dependent dehydrogenase (short-subunit alcohol dehydrogenase family)